MDDLISRQAAIDAVHEEFDDCHVWDESGEYTADEVERILDRVPSAQPENVRCKDCKYKEAENGFCEGRGWPMQLVPDDGFCDKGERSEE